MHNSYKRNVGTFLADYYLFKWKGASFDEIGSSGDRVAGYTVAADSAEELIKKHKIVRDKIKVISNEGKDITRHDLLTDLYAEDGFIYSKY